MRIVPFVFVLLVSLPGCFTRTAGPLLTRSANPAPLPAADPEYVWQHVVEAVNANGFRIEREERPRVAGDVLTEGRIDTFYVDGSTIFEPWRDDSANRYEKLESTLQSIRRRAEVRLTPDARGYLVDVRVFKELEDVPRPEHATAGAATIRHDGALKHFVEPVGGQATTAGWIPLGRDTALEQQILGEIQSRVAGCRKPRCD